jgi:UDP-galactopyranose mutase
MKVLMVGAGFSGAVVARELAEAGHDVTVVDERDHIGGNCHTTIDPRTGIMVHAYGPHIFHTDNEDVWAYVNRFAEMIPYVNRVKATAGGRVYALPINLHTINQLFETTMSPDAARDFVHNLTVQDIADPQTFEEQALKFVGSKIYRTFFHGYTKKQWGVEPSALPASILKRLPLRFSYDDNYFNHRRQAMPRDGYTALIEGILDCPRVDLRLSCSAEDAGTDWDHVVYSGPLDRYFQYDLGPLQYRTLRFEKSYHRGDFQGTAVMNYCDEDVPYTRISEHRYFSPWREQETDETVCFTEFSHACGKDDIPYYPLRLVDDKRLLTDYVARANRERGVTFLGRLGTYSYLDMDVTIARALETANELIMANREDRPLPTFVHSPI